MIIFLYGPDSYRSRRKLNEIFERYRKIHKSGLSLKYFEGDKLNFQDFKEGISQTSIFKEKKLLVLINAISNSDFKKKFLEEAKKNLKIFSGEENIILFYETEKAPKNDPLFLFLKKHAKYQEFEFLEGQRLKNWIKKEFESYKKKIDQSALEKIIDFVGNNLWQMENEIKKLVSYRDGETIEKKNVELLVKPKIETDIFETIDAIALKNKKKALQSLRNHLEKGDSPFYLFSMIAFQFRNLLTIQDVLERNRSPYSLSGLHPYVIKKSLILSKKFGISELKKIYQKIFQIDLSIKTGKVEPETALDLLISEI